MNLKKNFLLNTYIFNILSIYLIRYPEPQNLGYLWNFGSLAGFFLIIQILSGLFLVMFYIPYTSEAFESVQYIMDNIMYGWIIRYLHANGASLFFFVIYIHILRNIYYYTYKFPRTHIWFSGITIYLILMATAFLGYVLPWGQMSYWAAIVITNFITVLPFVGETILYWIWGGYSIVNATLNRFFCLHYLLPFIIILLSILHIILLHQIGSSTDLKIKILNTHKITFYPYYIIKDLITIFIIILIIDIIIFFFPEIFNHSINYIQADYMTTPVHIIPEWYFLPFYAILRAISNKTWGLFLMAFSIFIFYLLPIIDHNNLILKNLNLINNYIFYIFFFNFIFLGYLGSQTVDFPSIELGIICSLIHIWYICIYLPIISNLEIWILYLNIIKIYLFSKDHKIYIIINDFIINKYEYLISKKINKEDIYIIFFKTYFKINAWYKKWTSIFF